MTERGGANDEWNRTINSQGKNCVDGSLMCTRMVLGKGHVWELSSSLLPDGAAIILLLLFFRFPLFPFFHFLFNSFFASFQVSEHTGGKRVPVKNCDESIDNFLAAKKLKRDEVKVEWRKNVCHVSLT